ncbi:MAG: hypothetical protein ACQCN6_11545 [Candidatus Bathyarchaeia archaeon]|jgi:parallel beta-helix repeat protein
MKHITALLAVFIVIFGGFVSSLSGISFAQDVQTVAGTITADTMWSKAGGVYSLTGSVTVNTGVTLTLEPGTSVNLNNYALMVNGILVAHGTSDNQVVLSGGQINFTASSPSWGEQTGFGNIIERSVIDSVIISTENTIKIDKCTIPHGITIDGPVILSNSNISPPEFGYTSGLSAPLSALLTNYETVTIKSTAATISGNIVHGNIYCEVAGASPVIMTNTVSGVIHVGSFDRNITAGSPIISGNTVSLGDRLGIFVHGESPIISNNTVTGPAGYVNSGTGILLYILNGGTATVYSNTISGFTNGITVANNSASIIERNFITCCHQAISGVGTQATIKNNTLSGNINAIDICFNFPPIIDFNNFQNNSETNVVLKNMPWQEVLVSRDIDAPNNWWGTTDTDSIDRLIHDKGDDSALGKVKYTPFLTQPNPQALPDPTAAMPYLSPTPTPTEEPNNFNIESNSTVSALSFNATSQEISFAVNGTSGTTGFVKATIAKAFMPQSDNIRVYLDGAPIDYTLSSNQDNWIITFTYNHSIHQVRINQLQNETATVFDDPYSIYILAGIVIALVGLLTLLVWVARRKN